MEEVTEQNGDLTSSRPQWRDLLTHEAQLIRSLGYARDDEAIHIPDDKRIYIIGLTFASSIVYNTYYKI